MNKIEEFIEALCPNGVPFYPISAICTTFSGGFIKKTKQDASFDYPVYNGGAGPTGFYSEYNSPADSIAISGRGSIGFVNWVNKNFWAGNSCHVVKSNVENLSNKFLYYYLKHHERDLIALKNEGSIPALNLGPLVSFTIPVPPLEIQIEIVKILDVFSELEKELLLELDARKKQYSFCSKTLINDPLNGEPLMLEVFCEYRKERLVKSSNPMPYIGVEDLLQEKNGISSIWQSKIVKSAPIFKEKDILLGNIRPYLKKVWFAEFDGISNGDVLIFKIKDEFVGKVLPEFLYFVLSSDDFFEYNVQNSKGAKMPRGDKGAILKYKTTLPDIPTQLKIVEILNNYKDLLTNIDSGIPAEIESRKKQYEYYRDKLLTFKELEAA